MNLVETNAREMYADDLRLAIEGNYDCAFYVRRKGQIRRVEFDQLPLLLKICYYIWASAPIVDCTSRGWRRRVWG